MKTYLQNLSDTSGLLLKSGAFEVAPGESIAVSQADLDAGTFNDVIGKGVAKLVEAVAQPESLFPKAQWSPHPGWQRSGLTADELPGYLAANKQSQNTTVAGKVTTFGQS